MTISQPHTRRLEDLGCKYRYTPRAVGATTTRGVVEIKNSRGLSIVKAAGLEESDALAAAMTALEALSLTSALDADAITEEAAEPD